MKKAAVIGAAGYAGGELLRLLFDHPMIESVQCISQSQKGLPLTAVHEDLFMHELLCFSDRLEPCDIVFLCGDHGQSQKLIDEHKVYEKSSLVIDLSQDFRNGSQGFVYGLSEVNSEAIAAARRLANPGCFATAIQLAVAPLAKLGRLRNDLHITAITGSTGAGQKLQKTSHYSQRNQNMSSYKVFEHQHLSEIRATIQSLQGTVPKLHFVPIRGPFTRGIFASLYCETDLSQKEVLEIYKDFYQKSPFVHAGEEEVTLKSVVNSNHARLQLNVHEGMLHIVSCIDNLLKGASGQAIQNLNMMMNWPLDAGLRLKPMVY
jgi:N-acetyl-gamma-glutamyl-phosphate reductase